MYWALEGEGESNKRLLASIKDSLGTLDRRASLMNEWWIVVHGERGGVAVEGGGFWKSNGVYNPHM